MAAPTDEEFRAAFEEEARALAGLYRSERGEDLAALAAALAGEDFATVRAVGHRFRGSGATFGLPEASRLGALLEQAADRRDAADCTALAEALRAQLDS